jgi:hypothetical protein
MFLSSRICLALLTAVLLLAQPVFAFQSPLSDESVREAYFLGQRHDESTLSFFSQYLRTLPPPETGPYIAEIEIYTPFTQVIEASSRRSMGYSAQQAKLDYRRGHDKLYVRVRINFTDTYGTLELYLSAKGDKKLSGRDQPLPDFYRDFRVGLSQRSGPSREDQWIEPLRIILQPSYVQNSSHYPFIPEDLGPFAYLAASGSSDAYSGSHGWVYPTGWLAWLVFDATDVADDDATVQIITTDGQHVSVAFDLSSLR